MNERIQELWSEVAESNFGDSWEEQTVFMSKFAELIVAECLRQVEEQYLPVLEDKEMMKDTHWDGYVQCGVDSYVAIREHFGVEDRAVPILSADEQALFAGIASSKLFTIEGAKKQFGVEE